MAILQILGFIVALASSFDQSELEGGLENKSSFHVRLLAFGYSFVTNSLQGLTGGSGVVHTLHCFEKTPNQGFIL